MSKPAANQTKIAAEVHEIACADAIDAGFAQALRDRGIKTAEAFDECYQTAVAAATAAQKA